MFLCVLALLAPFSVADVFLPQTYTGEGRYFVTDMNADHVFVYDIDLNSWHDEKIASFPQGASLTSTTRDGQHIIYSSRSGDLIGFLSTGLRVTSDAHGGTTIRTHPLLSPLSVAEASPGHVETNYGHVVVFFDGTGNVDKSSFSYKVSPLRTPFPSIGIERHSDIYRCQ